MTRSVLTASTCLALQIARHLLGYSPFDLARFVKSQSGRPCFALVCPGDCRPPLGTCDERAGLLPVSSPGASRGEPIPRPAYGYAFRAVLSVVSYSVTPTGEAASFGKASTVSDGVSSVASAGGFRRASTAAMRSVAFTTLSMASISLSAWMVAAFRSLLATLSSAAAKSSNLASLSVGAAVSYADNAAAYAAS